MEAPENIASNEREQEMYDLLLTEDTSILLDEMDGVAMRLGQQLAEVYGTLERRGERKAARRVIHKLLAAVAQTAWTEIVPPSSDEDES